jgi:hypothetical protein
MRFIVLLLLALVPSQFAAGAKPDFLSDANKKGYAELLKIARQIKPDPDTPGDLHDFVRQNQDAFGKFRRALKDPFEAPASAYNPPAADPMAFVAFKGLGKALKVEAQLAETESNWVKSATISMEIIQLGQKVERGPLINALVGTAIELIGLRNLENVVPHLATNELHEVSSKLIALNQRRIPFSEIVRREHYFWKVNASKGSNDAEELARNNAQVASTEERYLNTAAYTEVIAVSMAAAQFERETGKRLTALENLTPTYLERTPIDPYTKMALAIFNSTTNRVIYSLGPNKKDDHGQGDDISTSFKDTVGYRILIDSLQRISEKKSD